MFKLVMDLICLLVLILAFITVLYYLFPIAQVVGNSMSPTLKDKQIVFTRRLMGNFKVKEGEIYIIQSPTGKIAVKRLQHMNEENDLYYFLGDNPLCSFDSRTYGYLSKEDIIAKVIFK